MPLIVTGCPRSGTSTIAYVLGIPHEQHIRAATIAKRVQDNEVRLQSECSWAAAPFAHLLLSRECRVVQIVRHPLRAIPSMMHRKLLAGHENDAFIRKHTKMPEGLTHLEELCCFWLAWNRMLGKLKVPRIRIEDVAHAPQLHRGQRRSVISWDSIPEVHDLAREYGYET